MSPKHQRGPIRVQKPAIQKGIISKGERKRKVDRVCLKSPQCEHKTQLQNWHPRSRSKMLSPPLSIYCLGLLLYVKMVSVVSILREWPSLICLSAMAWLLSWAITTYFPQKVCVAMNYIAAVVIGAILASPSHKLKVHNDVSDMLLLWNFTTASGSALSCEGLGLYSVDSQSVITYLRTCLLAFLFSHAYWWLVCYVFAFRNGKL